MQILTADCSRIAGLQDLMQEDCKADKRTG